MSWAEVKSINSNPNIPLNNLIGSSTNYVNVDEEFIKSACKTDYTSTFFNYHNNKFKLDKINKNVNFSLGGVNESFLSTRSKIMCFNNIFYLISYDYDGIYMVNFDTNEKKYIYQFTDIQKYPSDISGNIVRARFLKKYYSSVSLTYNDNYNFKIIYVNDSTFIVLLTDTFETSFYASSTQNKIYDKHLFHCGFLKYNSDGTISYKSIKDQTANGYVYGSTSTQSDVDGYYNGACFYDSFYAYGGIIKIPIIYKTNNNSSTSSSYTYTSYYYIDVKNEKIIESSSVSGNYSNIYDNLLSGRQITFFDKNDKNITYKTDSSTIYRYISSYDSESNTITTNYTRVMERNYFSAINYVSGSSSTMVINPICISNNLFYIPIRHYPYASNSNYYSGAIPTIIKLYDDITEEPLIDLRDVGKDFGDNRESETASYRPSSFTMYTLSGFSEFSPYKNGSNSFKDNNIMVTNNIPLLIKDFSNSVSVGTSVNYSFSITCKKTDTVDELIDFLKSISSYNIVCPVVKGMKLIFSHDDIIRIDGDYTKTDYGLVANSDGLINLYKTSYKTKLAIGIAY